MLQVIQFPAKTELKEIHHAHYSGLEVLFGSQHMLLPYWAWTISPIGLSGKGMQVCRQEESLVQGHNICLVWRLPGFCSELAPGPSPRV